MSTRPLALPAALAVLAGGLCSCAPSEDELRALGDARLGAPGRTVTIGYILPARTARSCCCPGEERWFELKDQPELCEVWPDAAEGERWFRGSSYLDPACLSAQGFLEARTSRRQLVRCAEVRCEGEASGGPPPPEEQVQVFAPTPALEALAREGTKPESVDYYVGRDRLGAVLEKRRAGLDRVEVEFQLREETTPLEACVLEGRSRRPSNNRKQDLEFRREDGVWR